MTSAAKSFAGNFVQCSINFWLTGDSMAHQSTMLELGTRAPSFALENTNPTYGGELVSLADCAEAPAVLIAFFCVHCPYVVRIKASFSAFETEYAEKGLAVIAINSNDVEQYTADGPEAMAKDSADYNYTFPFLLDRDQHVARAYRAACTPDFFLFDGDRKLVYRGQYDDARPGNDSPVDGRDLRAAADAVLSGQAVSDQQKASVGCNIKWRPGNEPDYF
jgi:peroxiredoxin